MCSKYAKGAAVDLGLDHHVHAAHQEARCDAIAKELKAYHRCADLELRQRMAAMVLPIENTPIPRQEQKHLEWSSCFNSNSFLPPFPPLRPLRCQAAYLIKCVRGAHA